MARYVVQHGYGLEPFMLFGSPRQRVVCAFALVGPAAGVGAPVIRPAASPGRAGVSLANIGTMTWETPANDVFLGAFDNGHLIGDQLGGPDGSFNLVPMNRQRNRGGEWSAFERAVHNGAGYGILAVKCSYTSGPDPRIPTAIEGAFFPIDATFAARLAAQWMMWEGALRHHTKASAAGRVGLHVSGVLAPHVRVQSRDILTCRFEQQDLELHDFPRQIVDMDGLLRAWVDARNLIDGTQWRVETDDRFDFLEQEHRLPDVPQLVSPVPAETFAPQYRLAARERRRYAPLDYLALRDRLHIYFAGASPNDFSPNARHDDVTFNAYMKTAIQFVNRYEYFDVGRRQRVYVSDARKDPVHPDPGTLGDGIVMAPEIDHLIPVTPADGGLRGPTIFSNAQLTSPRYNNLKSGNMWVAPAVTIGQMVRHRPRRHSMRGDAAATSKVL